MHFYHLGLVLVTYYLCFGTFVFWSLFRRGRVIRWGVFATTWEAEDSATSSDGTLTGRPFGITCLSSASASSSDESSSFSCVASLSERGSMLPSKVSKASGQFATIWPEPPQPLHTFPKYTHWSHVQLLDSYICNIFSCLSVLGLSVALYDRFIALQRTLVWFGISIELSNASYSIANVIASSSVLGWLKSTCFFMSYELNPCIKWSVANTSLASRGISG